MYPYLPDLLALQLESFRFFLEKGLLEELENGFQGITTSQGTLVVNAKDYKLLRPRYPPEVCVEKMQTYDARLYVPCAILGQTPAKMPTMPYYCLGKIPLLTDRGNFLINGVRRVLLNQMVRCPNIYYKVHLLPKNKRSYIVSFVSDRGVWLRLERGKGDALFVRINDYKKVGLFVFLRALGITDSLLQKSISNPQSLWASLEQGDPSNRRAALRYLGWIFGLTEQSREKRNSALRQKNGSRRGREFLATKLFSPNGYTLGKAGRQKVNQKFQSENSILCLTPEDILQGIEAFLQLERGILQPDDIDHLKNRRVRLLHELFQNQVRLGIKRLSEEKGIRFRKSGQDWLYAGHEKPKEIPLHARCIDFRTKQKSNTLGFDSFLQASTNCVVKSSSKFTQYKTSFPISHSWYPLRQDSLQWSITYSYRSRQTDAPIAQVSHGTCPSEIGYKTNNLVFNQKPLTKTLKEFFGMSQLSQFMDQTNPLAEVTQKRRLTSLGPGGVSREAGLAVRDIHPSHYGRVCPIETPEGKNAGLVNSLASHARVTSLGFLESPFLFTETIRPVDSGANKKQATFLRAEQEEQVKTTAFFSPTTKQNVLPSRFGAAVLSLPRKNVQFSNVSPVAMISVATALIPFLEHDDGNRALMGSNMQRQAVPLANPERPIVGTGMEGAVARDSRAVMVAQTSGIVTYTDCKTIQITGHNGDGYPGSHPEITTYALDGFHRSNHNTVLSQRPTVSEGMSIRRGDVLADTSTTEFGELSLGKNVLIGYMPWEGYNFEDAVLMNERVVYDHVFTSFHIERLKTETRTTQKGEEIFCSDPPALADGTQKFSTLDKYGLIRPGTWVQNGDILVGKKVPRPEVAPTPEERLLYAIFETKRPQYSDSSFRLSHGSMGRVVQTSFFPRGKKRNQGIVFVHVALSRPLQVGDKIAGRHGNKGIVSNVLPREDMPYLPDGTPLDVVVNPLGVPSRMNVGQLFECLAGLAGLSLEEYYRIRAFDELHGAGTSRMFVYKKLYEARKKTQSAWLFEPKTPGKIRLFDGRTGLVFENPITVGIAYILKLVHMVDEKIHARSIGPYSLITQQPLKGRSKHGGQRLGEMEVWALEGFGAAYTLQEMLTLKSDDMSGRNAAFRSIVRGTPFPNSSPPESFKLLAYELRSLCFDIRYSSNRTDQQP